MSQSQPTFLNRSSTIWENDNDGLRHARRDLFGYREISRVVIPRGRRLLAEEPLVGPKDECPLS